MQKLGKNQGRYLGETIEIASVLAQIAAAAQEHGWSGEMICETGGFPIMAWHRKAQNPSPENPRLYISTGIHGDEPAGPLAALRLLQENAWPQNLEVWLLPCLNPVGFTLNQRTNADGVDLNRDYRTPQTAESRAHISWLERQESFDCYFCLHEDWEALGFYLYEQNPRGNPSLAEAMIEAVTKCCPVDPSEMIEGRAARGGIIRPIVKLQDRPDWPEAFYLISHKSAQGYTLEAPSDFPLATRVAALLAATAAGIDFMTRDLSQPAKN